MNETKQQKREGLPQKLDKDDEFKTIRKSQTFLQ